jgi:hypothetical protein
MDIGVVPEHRVAATSTKPAQEGKEARKTAKKGVDMFRICFIFILDTLAYSYSIRGGSPAL